MKKYLYSLQENFGNKLFKTSVLTALFIFFFFSCATQKPEKWLEKQAPETFTAEFVTTKGNFVIEAKREWSPKGVDRLYQLIRSGYYKDISVFRVVPDFVAQFGIHNDTITNDFWRDKPIEDEAVVLKNFKGTLSFARSGKNTRSNQLYINLKDNNRLDTIPGAGVVGFPGIAKVVSGMEVVEQFYAGYGNELGMKQDSIRKFGNQFLKRDYPEVDYILSASVKK